MNLTDHPDKRIYRFDGFTVDAKDFVVEKDGEIVALTPRAFDVLRLLLSHAGHVVEKRQMFDTVWKESFVTDNALTKIIKELRHALGDSADDPRYIETVPKRGYRFIGLLEDTPRFHEAEVLPESADESSPHSSAPSRIALTLVAVVFFVAVAGWFAYTRVARTNDSPSAIAVLPFKPLDAESRDESLELGMAETLITRLSNLREIVVRPIGSVRKFTDPSGDPVKAGEQLQVSSVLDGSIQKSGDRIRVTVRLVDVRSGNSLWSEQFDESFTDIFRVQDSISQRIANVLALRLSRDEQARLAKHMTDDPEAYELYLRGQFYWHRRGPDWIHQSLAAYQQALQKDPNFALAHIGVADAYIMLSGHRLMSTDEAEKRAGPSIMKALEIDNGLAQAHNALAELKYQYQYDWRGAETEFKTAVELNPNVSWIRQAYGWFLMCDGRFEESNEQIERARQLDPASLTLNAARGRLYYYSRQYDRAIETFQSLLVQAPDDSSLHFALYAAYEQKKMYPEAFEEFVKVFALNGTPPEKIAEFRATFNSSGWEGTLQQIVKAGERRSESTQAPGLMARHYVVLGEREKAFRALEQAFEAHDVAVLQFKVEPGFEPLHDDPRYAELLRRIGQTP